jgi:hypothetical protein
MDTNELRQLLERLRNDLDRATGLDDSSREQMRALVSEIERGMNQPATDTERSLSDRLVEAMTAFEAQHPRLTETLSRLADQLGAMGI